MDNNDKIVLVEFPGWEEVYQMAQTMHEIDFISEMEGYETTIAINKPLGNVNG